LGQFQPPLSSFSHSCPFFLPTHPPGHGTGVPMVPCALCAPLQI
jgi:hypothetical protein